VEPFVALWPEEFEAVRAIDEFHHDGTKVSDD
jgi:hypothetical protein